MSINGTKLKSIDENSEKFIFDSVLRLSLYRAFKSQLEIMYGSTDQTHIQSTYSTNVFKLILLFFIINNNLK